MGLIRPPPLAGCCCGTRRQGRPIVGTVRTVLYRMPPDWPNSTESGPGPPTGCFRSTMGRGCWPYWRIGWTYEKDRRRRPSHRCCVAVGSGAALYAPSHSLSDIFSFPLLTYHNRDIYLTRPRVLPFPEVSKRWCWFHDLPDDYSVFSSLCCHSLTSVDILL